MHYYHVKVLVFICAATLIYVQVASEGSSGNDGTISEDQLKRIFEYLKEIDNSQRLSMQQLQNISHFLMTKIDNLEEQLGVVSGDLNEIYRSLMNILAYWTKHVLPLNNRVNKWRKARLNQQPLCPLRKCYRRSTACQHMVKSFKIISTVEGVTSRDGCALFCSEDNRCQAFRYVTASRTCVLIKHISKIIEVDDERKVEIWIKRSSRLGKCHYRFSVWGFESRFRSEYKVVRKRVRWTSARLSCEKLGGKLAELTTEKEIEFIRKKLVFKIFVKDWHVAGWRNTTESGWQWYYSKTPLSSTLLSGWDESKSKGNDKRFLNGGYQGKFYFKYVTRDYQPTAYLCECIKF